ncbi:MAG: glycosyltransferase family 4 protein [Bacteroidota bacterium]
MANVLHIADINVSPTSGMGRIAYHWQKGFEEAGHHWYHIGKEEVGSLSHPSQFTRKAKAYLKNELKLKPDVILAHEPVSGGVLDLGAPVALFSHGIEQREWNLRLNEYKPYYGATSLKSQVLFPIWRLRNCNRGLRKSTLLMLSNSEDQAYAQTRYQREEEDIYIFKNGVVPAAEKPAKVLDNPSPVIGFNGTWLVRKGIHTMVDAAKMLEKEGIKPRWLLFGVIAPEAEVLSAFPPSMHDQIEVVSRYAAEEEASLSQRCDIFILPSFYEGQSLALLQAMAMGHCCITTSCCAQVDLFRHKENGMLFEPGSAEGLAAALREVILDSALRQRLGKQAQDEVEGRTWQHVREEVVEKVMSHTL